MLKKYAISKLLLYINKVKMFMRKVSGLVICLSVCLVFSLGCGGCFENLLNNQVDNPQFSQVRGTNYQIDISSSTPGASVKYTIDGSDPISSSSAVAGNSAVIDFHTEIKSYAYKEDMIDSPVVSYRLPVFAKTTYIKYKTDFTVDYYSYYQLDGNEQKVIEVFFNGKGSDSIWFTEDDSISGYTLYKYDETGLIEETVYNSAGTDSEWFTSDDLAAKYYVYESIALDTVKKTEYNNLDVIQKYWKHIYSSSLLSISEEYDIADALQSKIKYDYTGNLLLKKTIYAADGITITGYTDFASSGDLLRTATEKDESDTTTSYSEYLYDNIEEYTSHLYDANFNLTRQTIFKGYGTDTESGLIEYTYNTDNKITTKSEYEDIARIKSKKYSEYFYTGTQLDSEVIYTSSGKDTRLYSFNYSYASGNLNRKDKLAEDNTTLLEYTEYVYDGSNNKIKETVFKAPDPNSKTISFNLTVNLGLVDGGFYYSDGANFDQEGDPIGTIVDTGSGEEEFIKNIIGKLQDIYDNLEITDNGIIITGPQGGNAAITVRVINNVISVTYDFNSYDDGDFIVKGRIIKTLQGSIDISGNLSGSLDGEITGELTITDANPTWTVDEFLKDSYITYTYLGGLLSEEVLCCNPGSDGAWDTADDTIKEIITYAYDGTLLNKQNVYKQAVSADQLQYHIDFTYDINSNIDKAQKFKEYGVYIKYSIDDGVDNIWNTISDNTLGYSSLEFSE
jgi:hypothetical protein